MNDRLSFWFPLLLLALLAGLSFWLDSRVEESSGASAAPKRHDPDFIVENFSSTRMGPDGVPRYALSANRMEHFPDDDSTHLEQPRFSRFDPATAPITVTSQRALISSNGESVYFIDDVHVVRAAFEQHSALGMSTNSLQIIPERDLVQTDKPVTLTRDHTTINAVGLELNNANRTVKLLSNVKGYYENPRGK